MDIKRTKKIKKKKLKKEIKEKYVLRYNRTSVTRKVSYIN